MNLFHLDCTFHKKKCLAHFHKYLESGKIQTKPVTILHTIESTDNREEFKLYLRTKNDHVFLRITLYVTFFNLASPCTMLSRHGSNGAMLKSCYTANFSGL